MLNNYRFIVGVIEMYNVVSKLKVKDVYILIQLMWIEDLVQKWRVYVQGVWSEFQV